MDKIEYIGEHLLPGQLGHFAIVLAFVSCLLAVFAYFKSSSAGDKATGAGWLKIARFSFILQAISVFAIIGTLFYMMINHYYEYKYVQQHVSDELPMKYIFSAFWEEQEGSFLLWMFWHVILGLVMMFTLRQRESSVMVFFCAVQAFLLSMILGIYIGSGDSAIHIGSNPFLLLRDVMDIPLFSKADYIKSLKGNGLNPLLQNYWMTIHPPTLFLGFASCTVPFAFAMAGLWKRDHQSTLRQATNWALFSGGILGIGILMGGAWAYEALSFGGYWAWDPVENMSLVPWLILVGGIHTNLIANSTGQSLRATYIFYTLTFLLVLYSTFLTRSGVLGDSSVHAFTNMGLGWQLVAFLGIFTILSIIVFARSNKTIPKTIKEEAVSSREFWMFIGALTLGFSSILITFTTSIPVYNKIFDLITKTTGLDLSSWHRASPLDPIAHHNKFQLWIALFIGLLSGFAVFLRYRESNFARINKRFYRDIGISAALAGILTYITTRFINLYEWPYYALLFSGYFGLFANSIYFIGFTRLKPAFVSSTMSHAGFGIMLAGILASGLNKNIISSNAFTQRGLLDEKDLGKNILLFKGYPMIMNGYEVTYMKDTSWLHNRSFEIKYRKLNEKGQPTEVFSLHPNVIYDKGLTKIAASNPSTKHYLTKDIFTHVAQLPVEEMNLEARQAKEDSLRYEKFMTLAGDSSKVGKYEVVVDKINFDPQNSDYDPHEGDFVVGLNITVKDPQHDTSWQIAPMLALRDKAIYNYPVAVNDAGLKIKVSDTILDILWENRNKPVSYRKTLKVGDTILFDNKVFTFEKIEKDAQNANYKAKEGDLTVGALLSATIDNEKVYANPLYVINSKNMVSDVFDGFGHSEFFARFLKINPSDNSVELELNKRSFDHMALPYEVAQNYTRSDFVVLEAIVFPGINLFWAGSILMMTGLIVGLVRRWFSKKPVVVVVNNE